MLVAWADHLPVAVTTLSMNFGIEFGGRLRLGISMLCRRRAGRARLTWRGIRAPGHVAGCEVSAVTVTTPWRRPGLAQLLPGARLPERRPAPRCARSRTTLEHCRWTRCCRARRRRAGAPDRSRHGVGQRVGHCALRYNRPGNPVASDAGCLPPRRVCGAVPLADGGVRALVNHAVGAFSSRLR